MQNVQAVSTQEAIRFQSSENSVNGVYDNLRTFHERNSIFIQSNGSAKTEDISEFPIFQKKSRP